MKPACEHSWKDRINTVSWRPVRKKPSSEPCGILKKARQMLHNLLEIGRSESGCFIACRFQPAESAYQALNDSIETIAGNVFEESRNCDKESEAGECLSRAGIVLDIDPQVVKTEMFQDEIKFRQIIGNLIQKCAAPSPEAGRSKS